MSRDTLEVEGILKPGQIIRPEVSIETAQKLIKHHFGYDVKKITELNSYDDKNFFVEAVSGSGSARGSDETKKFVFKVLNSLDSKKKHFEAENAAMFFLQSKGFVCPVPEPSITGSTCPVVEIWCRKDSDNNEGIPNANSRLHVIRLLSFVEGQILAKTNVTPELLHEVGAYSGSIINALKDFTHPGLDNFHSIWMLSSTPLLTQFLYVVHEPVKLKMVSEILAAFSERVVPAFQNLQKGSIHGDFNEQNVIVQQASVARITGVIDFGDLQYNYYVFEVAILLAYMMLECFKVDIDPLQGSGYVLAGFVSKYKLHVQELEILRICICSRLCQSVVLGRYSYTLDPQNDYLLTTAQTGWKLLDQLWNQTTDEELLAIWKHHTQTQ